MKNILGGAVVLREGLSGMSENQQGGQCLWSRVSKVESERDEIGELRSGR